jgi:hypothetical protein
MTKWVMTCAELEAGLRLGQEGLHACQLGPFSAPIYWTAEQLASQVITREMLIDKRRALFDALNRGDPTIACTSCKMVVEKPEDQVRFDQLGHVDYAVTTLCNLRCNYCAYTVEDNFKKGKYDGLKVLELFGPEDVRWEAAVDFNGGEPTLLKDFARHLDYFRSRRVRVFLFTNGVRFHPAVIEGLEDGTITWACISLDTGTAPNFKRMKGRDNFDEVVANVKRYADAARRGKGNVSFKYIFCEDNCGDDDIAGFVKACETVVPQEIWLTFDFNPLAPLSPGDQHFGGYSYERHVRAYAKTYRALKARGLNAVHYAEKHLAPASEHGRLLLDLIHRELARVEALEGPIAVEGAPAAADGVPTFTRFDVAPLRLDSAGAEAAQRELRGKRVVIAPMSPLGLSLLDDPALRESEVTGFLDRDPVLHGKTAKGVPIFAYDAVADLKPDVVLVASHERLRADILRTVHAKVAPDHVPSLFAYQAG